MTHARKRCLVWTMGWVLLAAGCAGGGASKKNRNIAKERWQSTRSTTMYALAKQQLDAGDLEKAESTVGQAMAASPNRPEHFELMARIMMQKGMLERAYRLLDESLALDANRSDAHYLKGMILERWQRYEPALASYEKAYELRADDPAGLLSAVEMLMKLDRLDDAIARLEDKTAYFENNAAIRVALGQMYSLRREFNLAVRRFREANLLSPDDKLIVEYLALAQCSAGLHAEAIEHLKNLLNEAGAERDDLRLVLGDSFMAIKRPVEARAEFLKVVERNGNDVNAWIKLGQASLMVGDTIRLDRAIDKALALAPNRPEGHLLRGLAEQKAGRHETAVAAFDEAAQLSPGSAEPLLLKGISLERLGDRSAAATAYRQALKARPGDERIRTLLAGVEQ